MRITRLVVMGAASAAFLTATARAQEQVETKRGESRKGLETQSCTRPDAD